MSIVDEIKIKNAKYESNNNNGTYTGPENFKIIEGKYPILLSAPHAVRQVRDGEIKGADERTGAIIEYMAERLDVNAIVRTCNFGDDPNYYNDGTSQRYKEEIKRLISRKNIVFFFDIHGCKDDRGFEINIGCNRMRNVTNEDDVIEIKRLLGDQFNIEVDDFRFMASGSNTVSNHIHTFTGISCIQLEVNKNIRTTDKIVPFIDSMSKIVDYLKEKYKNPQY